MEQLTGMIPMLLIAAIPFGLSGVTLNKNYDQGIRADVVDWFFALVSSVIAGFTALMTMGEGAPSVAWAGIPLAILAVRPMIRVLACPRKPGIFEGVPLPILAAAGLMTLVASFFGGGIFIGFLVTTALMIWAAVAGGKAQAEQEQRYAAVASRLASLIGGTTDTLHLSNPAFGKDGSIAINTPQPALINLMRNRPAFEQAVAFNFPDLEVAEMHAGRLLLTPASPETIRARQLAAETGGMITGEQGMGGGFTSGSIEDWD